METTKVFCISDIHLYDYPQRNPSEKYRLYQGRTVAANIIEVAKQNNAKIIAIAGDIIEKYLIRPYVQAEVKLFLDTLMSYFDYGYIIYGNHDQDNKGTDSCFTDSCLSVMLPPNLYYADKKVVNIGGVKFGFCNWRPEFDLSWIEDKVDILITHATISYNEDDNFPSQYLDETKFDLAICGDIHKPVSRGKYVSIGIPQRCKMSDSELSSAVVIDCATKTYDWVNLNPHDNLMKFSYTNEIGEEGWDENTGTWKVYKPTNQSISGGVKSIEIPAWEEVGKLTEDIIVANNLHGVHGEVLQNVKDLDSKEVDFNFVITRFYCKNWRSIDEVELFFNDRDKILITGDNGSGKSSLLSAIKYAFLENSSLKDYIQFGTKECQTEIEFIYQGCNHKIFRSSASGAKGYGYWIDGEKQKYNGKKDFNEDMKNRFPFIRLFEVGFYDSDHPRFIGDFIRNPERKSEIISSFYKLNRIDVYNEKAIELCKKYIDSLNHWNDLIKTETQILKHVEEKLGYITLPQLSIEDLEKKKETGLMMQRMWVEYNNYLTTTANLQASKESSINRLSNLKQETANFRSREIIDQEKQILVENQSWINMKYQELQGIKIEGRRLYTELQDLGKKKVCPSCGQSIKNPEHLDGHKKGLETKIQDLLGKQEALYQEFESKGIGRDEVNSGCHNVLGKLTNSISLLMSELGNQERVYREINNETMILNRTLEDLKNIGPQPQKIELPEGFMEQMSQIEVDLSVWNQYNSLMSDRIGCQNNIASYNNELGNLNIKVSAYEEYIKLTGKTGTIYKEIMTRLAQQFSDNRVIYKVKETIGVGTRKDHLDLESYYNLNGNEVSYVNCSDGQKTLLDIDLLSKIVTRMGLLVMDEFLKHLDHKNHDVVLEMIKQMNVGLVLVSSHMESIPAFNNKSMKLELNESGVTKITLG